MKQLILSVMATMATMAAGAQVVNVESVVPIPTDKPINVNIAKISPDATFAVVSHIDDAGLSRVDFATGAISKVAEVGSALELAFSPDGSAIVFKKTLAGDDHLRRTSVETVNLADGTEHTLAAPARHAAAYSVNKAGALSLAANGKMSAHQLNGTSHAAPSAVVSIHYGHLELTDANGVTTNLDPQGHGSYLWPSISPDGTKIVYYKAGDGCYVCNLDGSEATSLGYIHAPAWLGDNAVVGMQDYDDGSMILSSSIVASTLDGTMQTLTDSSLKAMYPSVSADASKVLFSTADGALYVINLK
jgi:hypothetical protein